MLPCTLNITLHSNAGAHHFRASQQAHRSMPQPHSERPNTCNADSSQAMEVSQSQPPQPPQHTLLTQQSALLPLTHQPQHMLLTHPKTQSTQSAGLPHAEGECYEFHDGAPVNACILGKADSGSSQNSFGRVLQPSGRVKVEGHAAGSKGDERGHELMQRGSSSTS